MHSGEGDATILIGVGDGNIGKASASMFNRIEAMNAKLKAENKRMHKLLRLDENADMHVEAKLEQDADRARRRDHILRKQDDKLSQELQSIMSAPTHGAPEQYTSAYVAPDGFASQPQEGENVNDAVNELLRKEKTKADEKLGLVSQSHSERDLARDYLSSSSPDEQEHDTADRRASSERSPRERRKLERMEHDKYSADMKMAETDLRNGHAHRAKHEAQDALARHEAMEKLRGFEGGEERKVPEAWKLLDRTIKDDLADRMETWWRCTGTWRARSTSTRRRSKRQRARAKLGGLRSCSTCPRATGDSRPRRRSRTSSRRSSTRSSAPGTAPTRSKQPRRRLRAS
eukprot:3197828-Rhodomonas_salina.1